jgi:flagellar assembly protein FliH
VRSRLAAAIDALHLQSERLAEQARADVLEVAFQVARRIVEVEVRQSPEPLFALVRTSLGQLAAARRISLRVSPQDIEALRGPRGQEVTSVAALAEIELSADAALEPGECLIDSDLGHIDGRLANRFAELRRHVAEASEGAA